MWEKAGKCFALHGWSEYAAAYLFRNKIEGSPIERRNNFLLCVCLGGDVGGKLHVWFL